MSSSSSISLEDESILSSYKYRNTPKSPFSTSLRHPVIYFVGTTHGKRKFYKKQNKANYFEKAFKWYTKEIGKGKSEKSGDNKNENIIGFASWLDMKYDEYTQGASKYNKSEKINNRSRPCTNDTCQALDMDLKSFEVLLEPKDVTSKAASVCYYQAATAGPDLMEEEKKCVKMPTTKSENNATDTQTVTQLITAQIFHEYIEKSKKPPCCEIQNADTKPLAAPIIQCQCDLQKILHRKKTTAICQCPSIVNKCAETQCTQGDCVKDKAPPPPPTPEPKTPPETKHCNCENIIKTADKLQQISKPNINLTDKGNDPDVKQCESCATNIPEVKQVKDRGCCPRDMDVQTSTHSFVVVSKFRVKHLDKAVEPPQIPASRSPKVHSCVEGSKPAAENVQKHPKKVDANAQTSVKSLHLGKDITTKDVNFPVYLKVIYDDKQVQKN